MTILIDMDLHNNLCGIKYTISLFILTSPNIIYAIKFYTKNK